MGFRSTSSIRVQCRARRPSERVQGARGEGPAQAVYKRDRWMGGRTSLRSGKSGRFTYRPSILYKGDSKVKDVRRGRVVLSCSTLRRSRTDSRCSCILAFAPEEDQAAAGCIMLLASILYGSPCPKDLPIYYCCRNEPQQHRSTHHGHIQAHHTNPAAPAVGIEPGTC